MLQMLWHKKPTQCRIEEPLLHQIKQTFLYAHCVHVAGAICLIDDSNLCDTCFSRIRTKLIREQYRLMRNHFFVNSHVARDEHCSICRIRVVRTDTIDNCINCALTVGELLRRLESTSTHVDDLQYPLVLKVHNRTL